MNLTVNQASLETLMQSLRSSANAITSRLDALEAELAPLRANWEGDAQEAYLVAKAQWDSAMAGMVAILDRSSVNVQASLSTYQGRDRYGAGLFRA